MATPNQRFEKNRIKPLFFKTPLLDGESITSWLIRASFRQGCPNLTFTYYYWQEYRLWNYDVDKGFNQLNPQIHEDMACLAETDVVRFNTQNLTYFAEQTNTLSASQKVGNQWVLPLSKRSRKSLLGYHYCPLCLVDDKTAYLKLYWRFSWYVYCPIHVVSLEHKCPNCDMPYQPNLIKTELGVLNYCHSCEKRLTDNYLKNLLLVGNAYLLQKRTLQVLDEQKAIVFDEIVTVADWFELMLFYINIVRKAAKTKDANHKYYQLLAILAGNNDAMNLDLTGLIDSDTGLPFDLLPQHERIRFMKYAYILVQASLKEWLHACLEIGATQNSFFLYNRKSVIPKAFLPIFNILPFKERTVKKLNHISEKPMSVEAVKKSWQRLQRKMDSRITYEQNIASTQSS